MHAFKIMLAASLAAFGQSINQSSQTPSAKAKGTQGSVTITANVRQVLVPVVVTDKKGHYVTDLKASDFQVFEDGAPQKIVAFSSGPDSLILGSDGRTVTHLESSAPVSVPQKTDSGGLRRSYLICVDTLHSSFANFASVRDALRKFFEQQASDDAQYALVALGRDIVMLHDSTRNPSELLAAVQDKRIAKAIQGSEAGNAAFARQQFLGLMRRYCGLCGCPLYAEEAPGCPGARANVQMFFQSNENRTLMMNERFLAGLNRLVAAIASMPTTRTIVFISDGFERAPGNELYAMVQAFGARDSTLSLTPVDTQNLLDKVIRLAIQNNVLFYTLDSRGLYTLASIDGSTLDASTGGASSVQMDRSQMNVAHEKADGLAELANKTGGLFFENSNDLLKGIRRAVADGHEHYVLAYVPSDKGTAGTYRRIHVEVKDHKLRVKAKPGYWASN